MLSMLTGIEERKACILVWEKTPFVVLWDLPEHNHLCSVTIYGAERPENF